MLSAVQCHREAKGKATLEIVNKKEGGTRVRGMLKEVIYKQWWLIWSSGGSLVVTTDCETAVLDSNPSISPAHSGLPILRRAAIWDGTSL